MHSLPLPGQPFLTRTDSAASIEELAFRESGGLFLRIAVKHARTDESERQRGYTRQADVLE